MPRLALTLSALFVTLGLGFSAFAQTGHSGHTTQPASDSPAVAAYRAINARMHTAMDIPFTGDADADFLNAMIPPHQGAVDMAEIVLQYGTNPEVRALAQAIVDAQRTEIDLMQRLLAGQ